METQKISVKKIALNYGVLWGLGSIVLSVVMYITGQHLDGGWIQTLIGIIIMIAAIVYGLKAFKKENEGFMSLGEAIKTGLAISVIAAIIGAIYFYVFANFIEPDFLNQLLENTREKMIEQNPDMPAEQLEMSLDITAKMMQPWIMMSFSIIGTLFFGFLTSLIGGAIMKQNRPLH